MSGIGLRTGQFESLFDAEQLLHPAGATDLLAASFLPVVSRCFWRFFLTLTSQPLHIVLEMTFFWQSAGLLLQATSASVLVGVRGGPSSPRRPPDRRTSATS